MSQERRQRFQSAMTGNRWKYLGNRAHGLKQIRNSIILVEFWDWSTFVERSYLNASNSTNKIQDYGDTVSI